MLCIRLPTSRLAITFTCYNLQPEKISIFELQTVESARIQNTAYYWRTTVVYHKCTYTIEIALSDTNPTSSTTILLAIRFPNPCVNAHCKYYQVFQTGKYLSLRTGSHDKQSWVQPTGSISYINFNVTYRPIPRLQDQGCKTKELCLQLLHYFDQMTNVTNMEWNISQGTNINLIQ